MAHTRELIAELKLEAANTRKMIERIPTEKLEWRLHEKSMTLGRLATHIAEIPMWVTRALEASDFDFATANFLFSSKKTTEEILEEFDQQVGNATASLQKASDESLSDTWTVRRGEQIFYQMPKKVGIRNFAFNHLYHHRGQLSVYLRLLGIPVPGMYGPSADEKM